MRPLNAFEQKNIMDYNKSTTLGAVRYNCVRAKELDDNLGAPQTGAFLLAMLALSNAIRTEIGLAPAAQEQEELTAAKTKKTSKAYKALASELKECEDRSKEQEKELEECDESIEKKDGIIDALNKDAEKHDKAHKELTKQIKQLTAANKKLTKGAK